MTTIVGQACAGKKELVRRSLTYALVVTLLMAATGNAQPAQAPQVPQRDQQLEIASMLVKNAITAVNHGNLTGNYTVLRDLGAPSFRDRNSAAQLATIFHQLRDQKTDLSPILVMNPQFTEAPAVNQAGQLQLVGYFPTLPSQVQFRLAFQKVQNGWMIDTVSINTTAAQAVQQNPGVSQAPPTPGTAPTYAAQLSKQYAR
jgi:hypothetical protein